MLIGITDNLDIRNRFPRGGGNFGIVTSFEYRVHPVGPTLFGGPIFYPGELAGDILRFYREWTKDVPDELTTLVSLATAPPAPFLPEESHGKPVVVIPALYSGDVEDGERAAAALRQLGNAHQTPPPHV